MKDSFVSRNRVGCCPDLGCLLEFNDRKDVCLFPAIPVWKLLCCPSLSIPNYQRKYCWVRKQVEGLLESIYSHPWTTERNGEHRKLHLGTVVLHQMDEEGDCTKLHIVDGQQRLITLSILFNLLTNQSCRLVLLGSRVYDEQMARHVYWASQIIGEWVKCHKLSGDVECLQKHLQIDAVVVRGNENLGKVYTFFNAINSSGKKLTDYDLLKPHHLRYLTNKDPKSFFAAQWDRFVQEKVCTFGSGGEEIAPLSEELLDVTLYRLRRWVHNRNVLRERHHVFEHFRAFAALQGEGDIGWSDSLSAGLGGGRPFFDFVSLYCGRYRRFVESPAVRTLHDFPASHRHAILLHFIRAFLFMYFCKFGDVHLDAALVFIMERTGRLRAKNRRIDPRWIFADPLLAHTASALEEAPAPRYFFAYCILPSNRYDHEDDSPIKRSFWAGVVATMEEVSDRLSEIYISDLNDIKSAYPAELGRKNDRSCG